jgi:Domain of unknown function (DUF4440)
MQAPNRHTDEPSDEFFRELEARRTRALVERDMQTVEQLHAAEYELITPAGKVFTREAYVAAISAEPFYADWQPLGEVLVRRTESMAVVRYMARLQFPSGRTVVCWHTDTYELRSSGWQAVWSQATELRQGAGQQ